MDKAQTIQIRKAGRDDLPALYDMTQKLRVAKDIDYFEQNLAQQDAGKRTLYIACADDEDVGYCILNWEPRYSFFRQQGIPETQDLNVLPDFRRRGIGTALIKQCESEAHTKGCETMGISVGLHSAYGPAQILYVKLGYIPDGQGVTFDRRIVPAGSFSPVDDNLCLMMVKNL